MVFNFDELYMDDIYFDDNFLAHYGKKHRSGRYPWGSGENPYQHPYQSSGDFLTRVDTLKEKGYSEKEICEIIGKDLGSEFSTTELRAYKSIALAERYNKVYAANKELIDKGITNRSERARTLGINESTLRGIEDETAKAKRNAVANTVDFFKQQVAEKRFVDIGKGVDVSLGLTREKMAQVELILSAEGYTVTGVGVPQGKKGHNTTVTILADKGANIKEVYDDFSKIKSVDNYISYDDGDTFKPAFAKPASLDSKRVMVRYADDVDKDGIKGIDKDGLVEIRRNVKDLSLQGKAYGQVRILVDGTHYIKGMAVYSDDLPDGVDVVFNTNKTKDTPMLGPKDHTVLKLAKTDANGELLDNPFGSSIKEHGGQYWYKDKDGKEQLSPLNLTRVEGDWSEWKDRIPSQFLSKQNLKLAKQQIGLSEKDKEDELSEIMEVNNPVVKKKLLLAYASNCDSAAVHLYAAALPRQKHQVILPINSLSDKEVYAPNFKDGEKVALIRYPHAGTFEIPVLTVNNKNKVGQQAIGKNGLDAVGINSKIASILSGADFDGDSVMVIPVTSKSNISHREPLKGLVGFDPKVEYPYREGIRVMSEDAKQRYMGIASNLISDMNLKGANDDEMTRAVKYSMTVIDAPKHRLDYKRAEADLQIDDLKKIYQQHDGTYGGATTIISRAKSKVYVPKTKGSAKIDPETGEEYYTIAPDSERFYTPRYKEDSKSGKYKKGDPMLDRYGMPKILERTKTSTKMAEAKDAHELVGNPDNDMENLYADYANKLKSLANKARKEYLATGGMTYDSEAAKVYSKEVVSLNNKLKEARLNAPKERQANAMATAALQAREKRGESIPDDKRSKEFTKELVKARLVVGAKRKEIEITDREWAAIQAGAISSQRLKDILDKADIDKVKKMATPRRDNSLRPSQISIIKAMERSGYTNSEIAKRIGVSSSTVVKYLKGD